MSSIPSNTQVQHQINPLDFIEQRDLQNPNPQRTAHQMRFIERLVGDVNPANPQASIITRMGYFIVDRFNAIAELFGRLRGSKEVLAQIELRSQLRSLAVELRPHFLVNEPKFQMQITPKIKEVASAFFERVEQLDSEPLTVSFLGKNIIQPKPGERKDPKFQEYRFLESQVHLFLRTMQALSNARRNPIPAVNHENLKKAVVEIYLKQPEAEEKPSAAPSLLGRAIHSIRQIAAAPLNMFSKTAC